jgi:predicted transcriptional regulator
MMIGDSPMLTLELDPKLEERLARLAKKTDRSPSKLAQELVAQGLDDVSDGLIALERMDNPEGWYSLEDLEEGRDLAG